MTSWECGIGECGERFEAPERLIRHQTLDHQPCECKVCGETVPDGFVAIRHAFEQHTRAEYVRAYDADSDDIRLREGIKDLVEERVDVSALLNRLEADPGAAASFGD